MVIVGSELAVPAVDIESSVVDVLVALIDAEPLPSDAVPVWEPPAVPPIVLVAESSASSLAHAARVRAAMTAAAVTVNGRGRVVAQWGQAESVLRKKR